MKWQWPSVLQALFVANATVWAQRCRCVPRDACWPSRDEWNQLNSSVNGQLLRTVPIGSPCHDPTYDADACANVKTNWFVPELHANSSSSIMGPYYTQDSCDPFFQNQTTCKLGNYVRFAINVTNTSDITTGMKFAQDNNIRLVIRNTGHDYNGKSTGYAALALWTHHVKGMTFLNYSSDFYTGPALKLSAGDQVGDMYDFLQALGYMAVGGACPTVGMTGGYTTAGGHSPLSSLVGLSADQTLEFEVILANGTMVTASPDENEDIYWALSGGGGGTFGIVWTTTIRVYKDVFVSGSILTVDPFNASDDKYWAVVDTFHNMTPAITDAGAYAYALYLPGHFQVWPLFGPNMTVNETEALIAPLVHTLEANNLTYKLNTSTYTSFNDGYKALFPPLTVGQLQWGSRLIPRSVLVNDPALTSSTTRGFAEDNAIIIEAVISPQNRSQPSNSVLPAWRNATIHMVVGTGWNDSAPYAEMQQQHDVITKFYLPALAKLAPDSGAYMNEADAEDPDWQQNFYGSNYPRLLTIKQSLDPEAFFYAHTAVGSEAWVKKRDGRLCRATTLQNVTRGSER